MTATRVFDMVDTIGTNKRLYDAVHIVDAISHTEVTLSDISLSCRNASSNLLDYAIRRGEYVALVKTDHFAECMACLCLQKIGAIPIIIDNDLKAEDYINIMNGHAIRYMFVNDDMAVASFRLIAPQMPHLVQLFTYEKHPQLPSLCEMALKANNDTQQIALLDHRTSIATTDDVALCLLSHSLATTDFTHKQLLKAISDKESAASETQLAQFLAHLHEHAPFQVNGCSMFATEKKKKGERSRLTTLLLSVF